jgi:hypothetical protein
MKAANRPKFRMPPAGKTRRRWLYEFADYLELSEVLQYVRWDVSGTFKQIISELDRKSKAIMVGEAFFGAEQYTQHVSEEVSVKAGIIFLAESSGT